MKSFSKNHTLLVKGIAICILFFHHLFYKKEYTNMYYWCISIHSRPLIQILAIHAKICVAIFVFLSAYGLTFSYKKMREQQNGKIKKWKIEGGYVLLKVKKLYLLYWPIFIICIAIGWITKCRIPTETYKSVGEFIRDFFGIAYIIDGESPFIGPWWYISFALVLYIFFPILYKTIKRFPKIILSISFLLGINNIIEIPIFIEIQRYFFVSCLGIYFADKKIFETIFEKFKLWELINISLLASIIFLLIRHIHSYTFDGFLVVSIVILTISIFDKTKYIKLFLQFLGKHSGNMFLLHGIIYLYLLRNFLYGLKYPIIIFTVLLVITLAFSIIVEYFKVKLQKAVEYLMEKKNNVINYFYK